MKLSHKNLADKCLKFTYPDYIDAVVHTRINEEEENTVSVAA
jgi:hypothetical protein